MWIVLRRKDGFEKRQWLGSTRQFQPVMWLFESYNRLSMGYAGFSDSTMTTRKVPFKFDSWLADIAIYEEM